MHSFARGVAVLGSCQSHPSNAMGWANCAMPFTFIPRLRNYSPTWCSIGFAIALPHYWPLDFCDTFSFLVGWLASYYFEHSAKHNNIRLQMSTNHTNNLRTFIWKVDLSFGTSSNQSSSLHWEQAADVNCSYESLTRWTTVWVVQSWGSTPN